MEASALTHASRRGLLARPPRLLRLQKDERLIALMRSGHERAFEVLFDRYNARLLAFCHHMLSSKEDAEDVLQEVFVAAHNAILADGRDLNVRPWLYRIARNRCLNHLRKPVADGQDTMDVHPHENGASTAERVQNREEFRRLIGDVQTLPETQRTALLLREVDAMSYEEIAQAMGTTIPSVKSLLVRARITLAEASQARQLTCGEVQLELAEAAEGLRKVSGPVRQHIRSCDGCDSFRSQLRADSRALAALFPVGPLVALKQLFTGKLGMLGGGSSGGGSAGGAAGASAGGVTASGATAGGAAAGQAAAAGVALGGGAAGGAGGIGGAIAGGLGAKTAAGVATAALLTAGAVEVKKQYGGEPDQGQANTPAAIRHSAPTAAELRLKADHHAKPEPQAAPAAPASEPRPAPAPAPATAPPAEQPEPAAAPKPAAEEPAPHTEPAADESAITGEETGGETGSLQVAPEPVEPAAPPAPVPPAPPQEEAKLLPAEPAL